MADEDLKFVTCARCGGPFVFAKEGSLVCATVISKDELDKNSKEQLRELVKLKLEMALENIMEKAGEPILCLFKECAISQEKRKIEICDWACFRDGKQECGYG